MDLYGEAKSEFSSQVKMGTVLFIDNMDKISVGADGSASRGKAEIALFDGFLLASIKKEDESVVKSKKLHIDRIHR